MIPKAAILAEAERLRGRFEAAGAQVVETDILQPAETLLDLYGEDIRARAYTTADPLRGERMLRPDFTVPVVLGHMRNGAQAARYTYAGEVFRKQEDDPDRPTEYLQVGLEIFGGERPETADAEVFAQIAAALDGLPVRPATGDIGVLRAVIAGLALSDDRRAALNRHLWRPRRFRQLIDRFAGRSTQPPARADLLTRVARGEDVLYGAGPAIGLRSRDEIAARLERLCRDADEPNLPAEQVALLDEVMALRDTAPSALEQLRDVAVDLPPLQAAVGQLARRLDALAERGIAVDDLPFEASFGRTTLEYYDGFVFGFAMANRPDMPPVATGGRYDALTRMLGQGRSIPAVGGMIRPATLLEIRQGAAG